MDLLINGTTWKASMAKTAQELYEGLRFTASLPALSAVVFDMVNTSASQGIDMAQMNYPLDIILIDTIVDSAHPKVHHVTGVFPNVPVGGIQTVGSALGLRYFVEMNSGDILAHSIIIGDEVDFIFPSDVHAAVHRFNVGDKIAASDPALTNGVGTFLVEDVTLDEYQLSLQAVSGATSSGAALGFLALQSITTIDATWIIAPTTVAPVAGIGIDLNSIINLMMIMMVMKVMMGGMSSMNNQPKQLRLSDQRQLRLSPGQLRLSSGS